MPEQLTLVALRTERDRRIAWYRDNRPEYLGFVAEVAVGNGRRYVGYELNPEYHKVIADRLGLFGGAA